MGSRERVHDCPVAGCAVKVPRTRLMCKGHWYSVPKPLRDEVWRAYRNGVASVEYLEARERAIAAAEGRDPDPAEWDLGG
jgi:hypothetical protein